MFNEASLLSFCILSMNQLSTFIEGRYEGLATEGCLDIVSIKDLSYQKYQNETSQTFCFVKCNFLEEIFF
jgi:hypothetical protein